MSTFNVRNEQNGRVKRVLSDIALHCYITARPFEKKAIHAAKSEISSFFIPYILLPCQNLEATIPTMQHNRPEFDSGMLCYIRFSTSPTMGKFAVEV